MKGDGVRGEEGDGMEDVGNEEDSDCVEEDPYMGSRRAWQGPGDFDMTTHDFDGEIGREDSWDFKDDMLLG